MATDDLASLQKKLDDLTSSFAKAQKELKEQDKKIKKAADIQDTLVQENATLKDSWEKAEKRLTSYVDLDSTGPGVLEKTKQLDYPPVDEWYDSEKALALAKTEQQFIQHIPRFFHRTHSFRTHLFFLTSRMRGFPVKADFYKYALFQSLGDEEKVMCMDYEPTSDDMKKLSPEEYKNTLSNVFEPESESVAAVEQYKARKQFVKEPSVRYLHHKHELFTRTKKDPLQIDNTSWYSFYHDYIDGLLNEKTRWELRSALRSGRVDYKKPKHLEEFRNYLKMYEQEMINLFHKGQLSEQDVEGIEVPSMNRINPHTVPDPQQPQVCQHYGLKGINSVNEVSPNVICFNCQNKGHYQRDCPNKRKPRVNLLEEPLEEPLITPQGQEMASPLITPLVASVPTRGGKTSTRGRGTFRGRGYTPNRRFRIGQNFRAYPSPEGYQNTYTRVNGIWYMEEVPVEGEEGAQTPPHSVYPPIEDVNMLNDPRPALTPEVVPLTKNSAPKQCSDFFLGDPLLE